MIYVTHDQIEAMTLADRIAVMKDQQIQQLGSPAEIYHRPANLFVAGFVGSPQMNFVEGRHRGERRRPGLRRRRPPPAARRLRLRGAVPSPGRPVVLGVRPEHLEIGDGGHLAAGFGRSSIVEPMGADNLVWCSDGTETLQVRTGGTRKAAPGDAPRPRRSIRARSRCSRTTPAIGCDGRHHSRPAEVSAGQAPHVSHPGDIMSVTDTLSIQLYTLRSLEDLDRMLDVVAGAGYRYVETVGSHLDKAPEVRAKLDARGLKASSSHVSLAALREKPDGRGRCLPHPRPHRPLHARRAARSSATWTRDGWRALGARARRHGGAPSRNRASASAITTTTGS